MPIPRRPLAFSLRALMVLVVLVAGWLAWERSVVLKRRAARADWAERNEAWLNVWVWEDFAPPWQYPAERASIPWIRRLFGDEPVQEIQFFGADDPDIRADVEREIDRATRLFPEASIDAG